MSEIKKQIKDFNTLTTLVGTEKTLLQDVDGLTSNVEYNTICDFVISKDIEQTDLIGIVTGSALKDIVTGITEITTDITDNSITFSKLNQISESKLLGNSSSVVGLANIEEIVLGNGLIFNGNTLDIDLGAAMVITNSDLPDSTIIPGTYSGLTIDQKGIVQSATNLTYLESTDITATAPMTFSVLNDISITEASLTVDGYLSATNFTTFSTKLDSVSVDLNGVITGTGTSDLNGDIDITTAIANNSITFNYLEEIPTNNILGNYSGSLGDITTLNVGTGLVITGSGDIEVSYPVATTWTPIFTGFSVDPIGIFTSVLSGKICTIKVGIITAGTSNSDSFTMTLPFIVKDDLSTTYTTGYGLDNGIEGLAYIRFVADSNIATVNFATPSGLWSTSGDKNVSFTTTYTIK